MHLFRDVLLDVWREACRHIDIAESAATLAGLLAKHLPLGGLLVRRFDPEHSTVVTVAVGQQAGLPFDASSRNVCTPGRWNALIAWACRGEAVHSQARRRIGVIAQLAPPEMEDEVFGRTAHGTRRAGGSAHPLGGSYAYIHGGS